MTAGRAASRFTGHKRTYRKPVAVTAQILLDRERCVLCQRCTRFAAEIAGDPFIALQERGPSQQIGRFDPAVLGFAAPAGEAETGAGWTAPPVIVDAVTTEFAPIDEERLFTDPDSLAPAGRDAPTSHVQTAELDPLPGAAIEAPGTAPALDGTSFGSYFAGNVVQICPTGALTAASYRFHGRPFDLVSVESVAEHDSSGSKVRLDIRRGQVQRRLAGDEPSLAREWLTDKDRFAFAWQQLPERLTAPLIRQDGLLRPASWPEAIAVAAKGLAGASAVGVLPGGRLTVEDASAYAQMARSVLGTCDIDLRARPLSGEETDFLRSAVAGAGVGVTFEDLGNASAVVLAGFEPEEEGGIVYLRLREAAAKGAAITAIAPYASPGVRRLGGKLVQVLPGAEAAALDQLVRSGPGALDGTILILGERLALSPGALTSALAAQGAGARLAWIPRRVGERGAIEAGCLPGPLPWTGSAPGVDDRAGSAGRDTVGILAAAMAGQIDAILIGGVELEDLPCQVEARAALERAFTVSLEVLPSTVTALADVVLPVAPPAEKSGTYINWEGRARPFPRALATTAMSDATVLGAIAAAMGSTVDFSLGAAHARLAQAAQTREPDAAPDRPASAPGAEAAPDLIPVAGQALLATWHLALDAGRCQAGDPNLAASAKAPFAVISEATAFESDTAEGESIRVSTSAGEIVVPVHIADIPDRVVWLPTNTVGSQVRRTLGASDGIVQIEAMPKDEPEVEA
jgi:NADH-quinone oxidoreductase subunit G